MLDFLKPSAVKQQIKYYVLHVEPKMEDRVKKEIKKRAIIQDLNHLIVKVITPRHQVRQARKEDGKPIIVNKKRFPGYLIVKAVHTDDTFVLINSVRGVLGYLPHRDQSFLTKEEFAKLKASGELNRPVALSNQEAAYAVLTAKKITTAEMYPEPEFKPGEAVKCIHGIFKNQPGTIVKHLNGDDYQVEFRVLGVPTKADCSKWQIEKIKEKK